MGACTSRPKPSPELKFDSTDNNNDNPVQPNSNNDNAKNLEEKTKNGENHEVRKKSPFFPFSPSPAHYLFSKKSPAPAEPRGGFSSCLFHRRLRRSISGPCWRGVMARLNQMKLRYRRLLTRRAWIIVFCSPRIFTASMRWVRRWGEGILGILVKPSSRRGTSKDKSLLLRSYQKLRLCEGGELLDRILSRGGKYTEDDAKTVMVQILNAVAFFHLQGVVHRDLKPENFLFVSKEENSTLKAIDFGLSDFLKPDEKLNDIDGSAYYVAPEVLHRSYSTEADVWSIGVVVYILFCGSRPFWARTESGIFRAVVKADGI